MASGTTPSISRFLSASFQLSLQRLRCLAVAESSGNLAANGGIKGIRENVFEALYTEEHCFQVDAPVCELPETDCK